jgi:translocation and assembly module TamB
VTGTAKAWVRRLDNSFFQSLTGGLPRIETDLTRTPDGILHLSNLQLYSPRLRLAGEGYRNRDGTFHIVAHGRQATYGPVRMILDGNIARPRAQLLLDRPNDTLGLNDVRLTLDPIAAGYD